MISHQRDGQWASSARRLNGLHRFGSIAFGLGLWVFGGLGTVSRLDFFSTSGSPVLGLSSNGLLSTISLVVGAVLIAAGIRGGRTASTVTVVVGAAFMASGVANVLVLDTALNVLAFQMPNVIFSLVSGGLLLVLGSWGRFTGRLPADNPYRRDRHPDEGDSRDEQPVDGQGAGSPLMAYRSTDVGALAELAEAERAVLRRDATAEQTRGVTAAGQVRGDAERLDRWRLPRP